MPKWTKCISNFEFGTYPAHQDPGWGLTAHLQHCIYLYIFGHRDRNQRCIHRTNYEGEPNCCARAFSISGINQRAYLYNSTNNSHSRAVVFARDMPDGSWEAFHPIRQPSTYSVQKNIFYVYVQTLKQIVENDYTYLFVHIYMIGILYIFIIHHLGRGIFFALRSVCLLLIYMFHVIRHDRPNELWAANWFLYMLSHVIAAALHHLFWCAFLNIAI